MNTSKAEVRSIFDPSREEKFLAKIYNLGMAEKWVNFTGPKGIYGNVPAPGDVIIVNQPDLCGDWYYVSTTREKPPIVGGDDLVSNKSDVSPANQKTDIGGKSGAGTGIPNRMVIADEVGNEVGLYNEKRPDAMNIKTELRSPSGKKIVLNDSQGQDKILIDANPVIGTNKITLTANSPILNEVNAPASIRAVSTGSQQLISEKAQISMYVMDGREINLRNGSTGSNKEPNSELYGNINLQSDRRDVNIFSNGEGGRIFIECLNSTGTNQVIQIDTRGDGGAIRIITQGKVDISAEDIGIVATGSINIKAGGNFNVQSGGEMNFRAGGNINSDGGQIHLNSGKSSPATPTIGTSQSYYGDLGVGPV